MPTGRRVRSACQACQNRGMYRQIVVVIHVDGVAHAAVRLLCMPCRFALMHLALGTTGRRAPRAPADQLEHQEPASELRDRRRHAARNRSPWNHLGAG